LIKIKEDTNQVKNGIGKIEVSLENNEVTMFDRYPIVLNSKELKYIHYEIQKNRKDLKNHADNSHGLLDDAKQKALEVKDAVVDSAKELSNKQKDVQNTTN